MQPSPSSEKTERRPRRIRGAVLRPFPRPVGGWNARDALGAMDKQDAVTLTNFSPGTTACIMRYGHANWADAAWEGRSSP